LLRFARNDGKTLFYIYFYLVSCPPRARVSLVFARKPLETLDPRICKGGVYHWQILGSRTSKEFSLKIQEVLARGWQAPLDPRMTIRPWSAEFSLSSLSIFCCLSFSFAPNCCPCRFPTPHQGYQREAGVREIPLVQGISLIFFY
jgi:hypothetical protein